MSEILKIRYSLENAVSLSKDRAVAFFKTNKGGYAENDAFMGITVPNLRKIAKKSPDLSFDDLKILISSKFNEERFLALIILVDRFQKSSCTQKRDIYYFYLRNIVHVNNWNLVDASAHLIIGAYLWDKDRNILLKLAQSKVMWERRIAIVATWYFIRNNDLDWTFKIASLLQGDTHDLIHKAVGWMLREAGKRNQTELVKFLDQHADTMPRTMLRYSIEKFSNHQRKRYLLGKDYSLRVRKNI